MKKFLIILLIILFVLAAVVFIGSGFLVRVDVGLLDYSVSEDGTLLQFQAEVMSSMGRIRGFSQWEEEDGTLTLTFHNTFGGLNSKLGAKQEFRVELEEETREVYFNHSGGKRILVLQKDDVTGEWVRP